MVNKNNASNVTAAKPKVGGAIYLAPLGTALPTDAKAELDAAFQNLGFVSESGLENENNASSEPVKEWGGVVVNTLMKEKEDKFKFTLIEALNPEVLKLIYGTKNVDGTLESGITVKATNDDYKSYSFVVDMLLKDGIMKRIVLPLAKVSEVGTVKYAAGENIGYETTVSAFPDTKGVTHYEYIVKEG